MSPVSPTPDRGSTPPPVAGPGGSRLDRWFEVGPGGDRSRVIEGVRGLAVAMVFLVHFDATFARFLPPGSLGRAVSTWASRIGYHGVDIFFVLSGFLIYRGVVGRKVSYATFFARRIRRIYPTFLAVFAIYLALSMVLPSYSKLPAQGRLSYIAANLLLLPGVFPIQPLITVAWSLSYEIFFYLSLPVIVGVLRMGAWRPAARIIFFSSIPIVLFLLGPIGHEALSRFQIFLPGMILADLAFGWRAGATLSPSLERLLIPVILGVAAVGVWLENLSGAALARVPIARHFEGPDAAVRQMVLIGGAAALLIWTGLRVKGRVSRLLSWRPLRYLGNMSYSYYLLHGLTLNAFKFLGDRLLPPDYVSAPLVVVALPVAFAATLVTSGVLFLCVEKPLSWKD